MSSEEDVHVYTVHVQWDLLIRDTLIGTQAIVLYSEVVPYSEVRVKTFLLCNEV